MADPLNVQHEVRLRYVEEIHSTLSQHLQKLQAQLAQIDKAFNRHTKSVRGTSSAAQGSVKIYKAFGKSTAGVAAKMGTMSKVAFGVGKALGGVGIAAIVVSKAFGIMYKATDILVQSQSVMAAFAAQTGKGSEAVFTLRSAYWDMAKAAGGATISIRDLTQAMSDFASTGFPQQLLASEKAVQDAIATLENTLATAVGRTQAEKLTSAIFQGAMKDNLPIMKEFLGAVNDAVASGKDMGRELENVALRFRTFDETSIMAMQGAMRELQMQAQGTGDKGVAAFSSWEDFMGKLGSTFENLKHIIIKTFGADLATMMDTANKKLSGLIEGMADWGQSLREYFVVAKVVAHNYVEVWKMAWSTVTGFVKMGVAGWGIVIGEFISWLPGELGKVGDAMKDWAHEVGKSGEEAFRAAGSPRFLHIAEEIEELHRSQLKLTNKQKIAVGAVLTPLEKMIRTQTELREQIRGEILPAVESWSKALEQASEITATLGELAGLAGANYEIMGQRIGDFTREISEGQIAFAKRLLDNSSSEKLITGMKLIQSIQREIDKEGMTETRHQALAAAMADQNKILLGQVKAYQILKRFLGDYTKDIQANLILVGKARDIAESQLKITQAVYGTPTLAIKAHIAIVKTLEQEKTLLKERYQAELEALDIIEAKGIKGRDLQFAQEALLDTQKAITDKVAEQLNIVKQLRDGYLDAVQAQAFGAGRFEKILITQEKNLMRGLEKGVAKRNYLLGQFSEASGKAKAQALRIGGQGMGQVTYTSGQALSPNDQMKEQFARIAGIDARQSGAAIEAMQIVNGMTSASEMNTQNMINAYAQNTTRVIDGMGGHIDRMATTLSKSAGVTGALMGTRAGVTAMGEAQRTGAGRPPAFPVNNNISRSDYAKQVAAAQGSRGGYEAMMRHDAKIAGAEKVVPQMPEAMNPKVSLDVTAANNFFQQALGYYEKFIVALGSLPRGYGSSTSVTKTGRKSLLKKSSSGPQGPLTSILKVTADATVALGQVALASQKNAMEEDALFKVAAANKSSEDAITKLRGKRQEIDARLLTMPAIGVEVEGVFASIARGLGMMVDIPKMGEKQLEQMEKLRDQRRRVQDEINELIKKDEVRSTIKPPPELDPDIAMVPSAPETVMVPIVPKPAGKVPPAPPSREAVFATKLRRLSGIEKNINIEQPMPDVRQSGVRHAEGLPFGSLTAVDVPPPISTSLDKELGRLSPGEENYVRRALEKEKELKKKVEKIGAKIELAKTKFSEKAVQPAASVKFQTDVSGYDIPVMGLAGKSIPERKMKDPEKEAERQQRRRERQQKEISRLERSKNIVEKVQSNQQSKLDEYLTSHPIENKTPPLIESASPQAKLENAVRSLTPDSKRLSHGKASGLKGGIGGNAQGKMQIITKALMGIAKDLDVLNDESNSVTQYASGRGGQRNLT